ncbi:Uncharacterised protein [Klebsiella pneumoniae]|nr:Uncharacterised protein [Klebsiella pneumoniae]
MARDSVLAMKFNALDTLLESVDAQRVKVNSQLDEATRGQKGQFMTPAAAARILASKFCDLNGELRKVRISHQT